MFEFMRALKEVQKQQKTLNRNEAADLMAKIRVPAWLEFISAQTTWMIVLSMWFGSGLITALYHESVTHFIPEMQLWQKVLTYSLIPIVFGFSFVLIGGTISQIGQFGEVPGKFPRVAGHPIYALRRIYGVCWSQVFYFKPLYSVFLAVPALKKLLFKLYGYSANTNFTLYPDAWVRDLPLLKIGEGVYLANRCTIGTNLCLKDGSIVVGECRADDKSLIGHLAIFALDSILGKAGEVGIGATVGLRARIADNAFLGPHSMIYHGGEIGTKTQIGPWAYIGLKAKIAAGIEIAAGAVIPNGAIITTQDDANRYFSSENQNLKAQKQDLTDLLRKNVDEFTQRDR